VVKAGTLTPPRAITARSAIGHSGRFSDSSSTRSPAPMPCAASQAAIAAAPPVSAPQLMVRQAPSCRLASAGRSRHCAARLNSIVARFGHVG
jgi:hypothetical protein